MPGSRCQAPWGYLLGVDGLLWGIWGDFVTLGVDKLRSLVYAVNGVGFNIRGDGKHSSIKVKTINVDTLEETFYDSITECADGLGVTINHLHRSIKNGWKVHKHRIIKLEDKKKSYAVYGVDKITNKVKYTFPSIRAAGRELGSASGCNKSLKHPHRYTWKGCYWFYDKA
jgi:hypothetical protein